jgi:hypothetical protein
MTSYLYLKVLYTRQTAKKAYIIMLILKIINYEIQ